MITSLCTSFRQLYIPEKRFGSLGMAVEMIVQIISRENNVMRVRKTILDRLYIAHTQRIVTTSAIINFHFQRVNYATTHDLLLRKIDSSSNH